MEVRKGGSPGLLGIRSAVWRVKKELEKSSTQAAVEKLRLEDPAAIDEATVVPA